MAQSCAIGNEGRRCLQTQSVAGVAQLVERLPSKQKVAGSRPVPRSTLTEALYLQRLRSRTVSLSGALY